LTAGGLAGCFVQNGETGENQSAAFSSFLLADGLLTLDNQACFAATAVASFCSAVEIASAGPDGRPLKRGTVGLADRPNKRK
jgi:hypothetical protein